MKNIVSIFILLLVSGAGFSQGQFDFFNTTTALGSTAGSSVWQTSLRGSVGANGMLYNTFFLRSSAGGGDWGTAYFVDGIGVDGSFNTPTTAKTWVKRDPVHNTFQWGSEGNVFMTMKSGGLGIGTQNPDSPLTVNGSIHAKEVKVDLTIPAPDYVFDKSYNLPDLKSVEKYVTENKHLPEIPSAKEMEENGLMLKEMNLLLLKKIEELTLYVIDQQKQIDELKAAKK